MNRENRFVILMTNEERATIEALAKEENLSASTYARRLLLMTAKAKGISQPLPPANNSDVM